MEIRQRKHIDSGMCIMEKGDALASIEKSKMQWFIDNGFLLKSCFVFSQKAYMDILQERNIKKKVYAEMDAWRARTTPADQEYTSNRSIQILDLKHLLDILSVTDSKDERIYIIYRIFDYLIKNEKILDNEKLKNVALEKAMEFNKEPELKDITNEFLKLTFFASEKI